MKKIIKHILITLVWFVIAYLSAAFIEMEINPINWGLGGRFLVVLFGLILPLFLLIVSTYEI